MRKQVAWTHCWKQLFIEATAHPEFGRTPWALRVPLARPSFMKCTNRAINHERPLCPRAITHTCFRPQFYLGAPGLTLAGSPPPLGFTWVQTCAMLNAPWVHRSALFWALPTGRTELYNFSPMGREPRLKSIDTTDRVGKSQHPFGFRSS